MPGWLSSYAATGGNTARRIIYPASLDVNSIPAGVAALDAAIREELDADPLAEVVVEGHSEGAQVAGEWINAHADDVDAPDAARLSFVLTGNPQRALGRIPGRLSPGGVPLLAIRDDTQYTVTDIARRYDGWCNNDNWPAGPTFLSPLRLMLGQWFDHTDYNSVHVDDPTNMVRAVVGNTTYLVTAA